MRHRLLRDAEPPIRRETSSNSFNAATDVGGLADSPSKVSQASGARLRQTMLFR